MSVLLVTFSCNQREVPPQVQKDIDSITQKWAPDKRENICEATLEKVSQNILLVKGETNLAEAKYEIIRCLGKTGFQIIDSLKIIPDDAEVPKKWGLVTVSVCNIKNEPSFAGEQVSQAVMGTPVRILKVSEDWLLIQTPDHYLGWTTESSISEVDDNGLDDWQKSDRVIFLSKSGDIISDTEPDAVVSDVTAGAILAKTAENRNYYIVKLPDGRKGMIEKKNAEDFSEWCSSVAPDPGKMIRFAESLNGSPYMWGGTSTKAIDCSGFVKTTFFMGGIILARDASQQFLYGEPVDISSSFDSLLPGDLVFFGHLNEKGTKHITHVGMYIGDTEVIHSSGMVRINSLDSTRANFSSYLLKTLMGARRVIGAVSQKGIESVALNKWYVNKEDE